MHIMDQLIEKIIRTKNPSVIGLDPDMSKIPTCYKTKVPVSATLQAAAHVLFLFCRDIIDAVSPFVPAVKPQMAFFEKYGSCGVAAFEQVTAYAKTKGLAVIEDAKRNDIGNTAKAYADGHLGQVEMPDGSLRPSLNVDFLTVSPFLGSESLEPFIESCQMNNKGIFVLVKTSNKSSGEIQDVLAADGQSISQHLADYIARQGAGTRGTYGYSAVGAVVGATYPEQASVLRNRMPGQYFLVPGYGAQGGKARDILPCFHENGLGAIVNASRAILYDHMTSEDRARCTREQYMAGVKTAVLHMQKELYSTLKKEYPQMIY